MSEEQPFSNRLALHEAGEYFSKLLAHSIEWALVLRKALGFTSEQDTKRFVVDVVKIIVLDVQNGHSNNSHSFCVHRGTFESLLNPCREYEGRRRNIYCDMRYF